MIRKVALIACLAALLSVACFAMGSAQAAGQAPIADFAINTDSGRDCFGGSPSMVYDGENFFVVWTKFSDIYGARVTKDGEVLDPGGIAISCGGVNENPTDYRQPSVAFDGTNYMVIWAATRSGVNEVYGCRVSKSGQVLDPQGIKLTTNGSPKIKPIGIAFNGTNYLIVWRTLGDLVMGSRISTAGVALNDAAGFQIAGNGFYPSVAYDPGSNTFLVAWHHGNWGNMKVSGARVAASGTVLDPVPFPICNDPGDKEYARVASDGANFMVIWYDHRQIGSQLSGTVYGTRVTPQGTVLDTPAFLVADRVVGQIFPNIVFDGTNYLAVWSSSASWDESNFRLADVYAAQISPNGQVLEKQPIPVSTSFEQQFGASLAYGDGKFLVAWNESRLNRMNGANALFARLLDKGMDTMQSGYLSQSLPAVSWAAETLPIGTGAYTGVALSADRAYLFCKDNNLEYKNGAWNPIDGLDNWMYTCWAEGQSDVWAGGWAGQAANGEGNSWQYAGTGSNWRIVTGLWGGARDDVWASLSYEKNFLHYDGNNANNWTAVPSASGVDCEDIAGIASDDIYAVGERGTVQHYDGTSWSLVAGIPTIQTLNALWIAGRNDIFAVGDYGAILHYDGTSWELQRTCTTDHLNDVWGVNGQDVYAVGTNGAVIHYDGSQWSLENAGTTADLTTVFGGYDGANSTCTIWAAGYGTDIFSKTKAVAPMTPVPADFRAESPNADTVDFSWTPPDSFDLTGYRLEYRVWGSPDWTSVDLEKCSSYSLSGLDNSLSYDFRLSAQYNFVFSSAYTDTISGRLLKLRVSFDAQNQIDTYPDLFMSDGSAIEPPTEPAKLYCVFSGWYTDAACTDGNEWDFEHDTVTENVTLYAKWVPQMCDVAFNAQNGAPAAHVSVPINNHLGRPDDPTLPGSVFGGWYTDAACTDGNAWDFDDNTVTGDITLYTRWVDDEDACIVIFDSQGGSDVPVAIAQRNTTIAAPVAPTRGGFNFGGWYKEAACTHAWVFATDIVAADITLYARWMAATPGVPTAMTPVSAGYDRIRISWAAVPYASGYEVHYSTTRTGSYRLAGTTTAAYLTKTGLTTGKTYYFKVRAYRLVGSTKLYGGFCSPVARAAIPSKPVASAAPASYNSIKISWAAVAGITKYELYRSTSSAGTYKLLTATTVRSYINSGVNTGTAYYYKVRAYRLVGSQKIYSADSSVVSAKTTLAIPTWVKAAGVSSTGVKVSWRAVPGATKYEVWRATSSGGAYRLLATTGSSYYTNTGLTTGRYYYYKVRAYRLVGATKIYGGYSSVVSAKPIPAVQAAGGSSSTAPQDSTQGQDVVEYAKTFIGKPYVYGAEGPDSFDCSGLVWYVYKHFNITVPRTSSRLVNAGTAVQGGLANARPGDILCFGDTPSTVHHVAIYVGNNQYIHAPQTGEFVRIDTLSQTRINTCQAVRRIFMGE